MPPTIDPQTLEQLRARDPHTLTQCVQEHNAALLGVSYGLGWQDSEAEDLVQETWHSFLKGLDTFEGRSSLKTYLIGILYNKSLERWRAAKREQATDPIDDVFEERFGMWGLWRTLPRGPEDAAHARENAQLIEACLQGLSPDQRMAFYLKEVEHETTESLCNILAVSVTHLGVLLFRARNKIRECIQRKWNEPT